MRNDSLGMFWQDIPVARGKSAPVQRPQPPIPETGWLPPATFPDLRGAPYISLDTETKDPELLERGPGWATKNGHIVGVSLAVPGHSWYFPMRHEVEGHLNIDAHNVLRYLSDTLGNPHQPKIGANLLYDLGWLQAEGVQVRGELHDVQFAEALLDEFRRVGLDHLMNRYLGEGKETNLLYQWCADFYGGAPDGKQRANIYRSPPQLVGPYAEVDAQGPAAVLALQYPELVAQGLDSVYRMECALIPLLIAMRMRGVKVDLEKAERVRDMLTEREQVAKEQLERIAECSVNVDASADLARVFDNLGIKYGLTAKGAPSFTQGFLDRVTHPVAELIREVRKCAKLRGTFIESYILGKHVDGRVHCLFHPMRGEEKGTRSGRFSSSDPNLQNIPSRDKELAPLVRGMFVPDEPGQHWRRYDYSQIEYRGLVHYAVGPGADEARARYHNDPTTDYHVYVVDEIRHYTGIELDRKPAKNINFGLVYGMMEPKLAGTLGLTRARAKELFEAYHKGVPFVRSTMDATMQEAQDLGYITTVLGRRSRFELWEPAHREGERQPAMQYEEALRQYGTIKRAYLHKALNRRLQGSAADIMKVAMLTCWQNGIFDATGVPHVTVHDELGFSCDGSPQQLEAFEAMAHVMETALPMRVPIKVECETGPDWGSVE